MLRNRLRKEILEYVYLFLLLTATSLALSCAGPWPYDVVFPDNKVNRIDIVIPPENWQAMLADMTKNYGEFHAWNGEGDFWVDYYPTIKWPDGEPLFVQCNVVFEEKTWQHVGIRFKGEITLMVAWHWGNYKLPFKLDFDQFEDEYLKTRNQRFYRFKQLSFSNSIFDESYLRGKVAADIFREEGIPTPRTAFYRVFFDVGDGPVYFGLYTMWEVPDRPMLLTQFGDDDGNLYRPSKSAAEAWKQELPVDDYTFPKKTNEEKADFSDIEGTIAALHANRDDPAVWRASLDKKFDTLGFMKWFAVNTVIEGWDISGNSYLYGDPSEDGRLHWMPWDLDMTFPDYDVSEQGEGDNLFGRLLLLDMSNTDKSSPLIRFLIDDNVYRTAYRDSVREFDEGIFSVSVMKERFQREHDLIASYVVGDEGELPEHTYTDGVKFDSELIELFNYVETRHADISEFLSKDW